MKQSNDSIGGYSNRVLDGIRFYTEQETHSLIANPRGHKTDRAAMQLKYQHYVHLNNTLKRGANKDERRSLRYVRKEIRKLRARLNPTISNKILYSGVVNAIRDYMTGKYALNKWHRKTLQNEREGTIRAHNLISLQDKLKGAGFKMSMEGPLKKMIDLNLPEFHLRYNDPLHCKNTDFTLFFKKIPGSDVYYLEKYDAMARPTLQSVLRNEDVGPRQSFSLLENIIILAIEAANLLLGRSIFKEIDGKETWQSLDFLKWDGEGPYRYKSHNFDLEKALEKLPIKQMENPTQRKALLDGLKMGNEREVNMTVNGRSVKYTLEAAPHLKTIHVFDSNGRLQDAGSITGDSRSKARQKLTGKAANLDDGVISLNKTRKRSV